MFKKAPKKNRMTPQKGQAAFTLIEMLVVISIISILISILLPTLRAARDSARSVQCLSQLHQMGLGFSAYHVDHNDYFVPERDFNGTPANPADDLLWPANLQQGDYVENAWLYKCPTFESESGVPDFQAMTTTTNFLGTTWRWIHYGYNFVNIGLSARLYPSSDPRYFEPARQDQITRPSKTITLVDSVRVDLVNSVNAFYGTYAVYDFYLNTPGDGTVGHGRHNNAVNVLWTDSHASSVGVVDPFNVYPELTDRIDVDNFWDRQ